MKVVFLRCPPGYCCKDCVRYDSCNGDRFGTLCGQCPEGKSESLFSTQCISNTECSFNYFFMTGTTGMLVLYLAFFLYHQEIVSFLRIHLLSNRFSFSSNKKKNIKQKNNNPSRSGIIKILFYYYQVFNLLRGAGGFHQNEDLIHPFENVVSRVISIILVVLPSFKCTLQNLRAVFKAVILHSVGYCLLGLLSLLCLISKLLSTVQRLKSEGNGRILSHYATTTWRNQEGKKLFSQRVTSAFTYISLLMYASSVKLCLSLLHCVPVGDRQVLFLDGNIKCYQTFQYFLLAYIISCILPFCLVPVLGSYLLKFDRIGVKQFCAACILPLPFCCYWMYLLLRKWRCESLESYRTMDQTNTVRNERELIEIQGLSNEITSAFRDSNERASKESKLAILSVLLDPFRPHKAFVFFPSSRIPWEGFLIFRRLALIVVLTFVYDIQLRIFLALTLCVAILILHMVVQPFKRKSDNLMETFSLGTHVILCASTLIKALHYGEDSISSSKILPALNLIENILLVAPLSVVAITVVLSVVIKFAFGIKHCVLVLVRKVCRVQEKYTGWLCNY